MNTFSEILILNKHRLIYLGAILIFFITALNSSGFHHPDEHYQIIQFANYKRGLVSLNELPWEYQAKIRSGLQPLICYVIFNLFAFIGITNPFNYALGLRLLTASLSLLSIKYFIKKSSFLLPEDQTLLFSILSYFIWFIPYISVRFSSESLCGIFFLFAAGQALNINGGSLRQTLILGITLGAAILFRYQAAFLVLGLLGWILISKKCNIAQISAVIGASLIVIAAGFFIDRWLYGQFTCTLFNYYKANIIDDIASQFGVSPWYDIILYILLKPWLPFGIVILSSFILISITKFKNIVTWCLLPFLAIHTIVGHKELRFLFPIVNFIPLTLMLAINEFKRFSFSRIFCFCVITFALLFNSAALIFSCMQSTGNGENKIAAYIYDHFDNQRVNLLTSYYSNPYNPYMHYAHNFYMSDSTHVTEINSIWQLGFVKLLKRNQINLLVTSNSEITGPLAIRKLKQIGAKKVSTTENSLFGWLSDVYDKDIYDNALSLYVIPAPLTGSR